MIHCLIKLVKLFNLILFIFYLSLEAQAKEPLFIGTTTSTHDSGLIMHLKKIFENNYNCEINVISQGTGQIINTAKMGNIDITITHNEKIENKFINDGYGIKRVKFMYNDFIIVGPKNDPAKLKNAKTLNQAMRKIYDSKNIFISRSDQSGTHLKELELWQDIGLESIKFKNWYKKIGQGMGATLNMTNSLKAYTLSDRATWLSFINKINLKILFEGDKKLLNQYSVILLNQKNRRNKDSKCGENFVNWILSNEGKVLINNFQIEGNQVFFYNGEQYIEE
tara:strand:+ start:7069 stop:7908 length:840 start_codon:yes stop_codon:yes gene_type:complete